MIPGLSAGLSLSGGSSEASGDVEAAASGHSGINLYGSKGLQAKDIAALALPALLVVGGLVVVVKLMK